MNLKRYEKSCKYYLKFLLLQLGQENKINISYEEIDVENEPNNDRELIYDFLIYTKEVKNSIEEMESNNTNLKRLIHELNLSVKSIIKQETL